jgi:hypothetical protein
MTHVSTELIRITDVAEPLLRQTSEEDSGISILSGGWSRKQVLGHLIDSASNNHQRFVRACIEGSLEFPGYDQDGCVKAEAVHLASWTMLIQLWTAYNRYLAHVIAHIPAGALESRCRIGAYDPVTLGFLIEDYVRHLKHHLEQIGVLPSVSK